MVGKPDFSRISIDLGSGYALPIDKRSNLRKSIELELQRAYAAGQLDARGWRPISEAPRDREIIYLWFAESKVGRCRWLDEINEWYDLDGDQIAYADYFIALPPPPSATAGILVSDQL